MSSRGTATERLAKWLEYQLKPFAKIHDAYIKDTKSFLLYLEHLSLTTALFKEGTNLLAGMLRTSVQMATLKNVLKQLRSSGDKRK